MPIVPHGSGSFIARELVAPAAPLSKVDVVVTDSGLEVGYREMLKRQGAECVVA